MTKISLDKYIKDLKELPKEMRVFLSKQAEIISLDAAAEIQERVQQTGKDFRGNPFSDYSEAYKKFRQKKGKESAFKNFTFTTEMWNKFGIVKQSFSKKGVVVKLGGKNRDSQIKINVNSKREGISIIEISKKEEDKITKFFDKRWHKFLQARL